MARIRCVACETLVAENVPEAQARHIAETTCQRCSPGAA